MSHSLEAMMYEAMDLHNEIVFLQCTGLESFGGTNIVQKAKRWWGLFITLVGRIISAIGNGIKAAGRFVARMWTKYIGSRLKVRSNPSTISRFKAKVDRLIKWLGRKIGFIKDCQKDPESVNDSFTQSEIDEINEELNKLSDILDEMLGSDSPLRQDLQDRLDDLGLESYQGIEPAMEATDDPNANWLKGIFSGVYNKLFKMMDDSKTVEGEVKRDSESASRQLKEDNIEEQTEKQAWYSKLANAASKAFNAVMRVIQWLGKVIHGFFAGIYDRVTGRGGVTVETNSDIGDAPDLNFDDIEMDVGGL